MKESIITCFQQSLVFSGYTSRRVFWRWILFVSLLLSLLGIPWVYLTQKMAGTPNEQSLLSFLQFIFFVLLICTLFLCFLPTLSVCCRRLKDAGLKPWIIVFPFVSVLICTILFFDQRLANMDSYSTAVFPSTLLSVIVIITIVQVLLFLYFFLLPSERESIKSTNH